MLCKQARIYLLEQKEVVDKFFRKNMDYYNSKEGQKRQEEFTEMHIYFAKEIYCKSAVKNKECPLEGKCVEFNR